jgi:hypothetical protein
MTAFVLLAIAVLAAFEVWLVSILVADVAARFRQWQERRDVVRRSAADQEMQAMRAAQELSLMAWRARHEIYDITSQGRASKSDHPTRRE